MCRVDQCGRTYTNYLEGDRFLILGVESLMRTYFPRWSVDAFSLEVPRAQVHASRAQVSELSLLSVPQHTTQSAGVKTDKRCLSDLSLTCSLKIHRPVLAFHVTFPSAAKRCVVRETTWRKTKKNKIVLYAAAPFTRRCFLTGIPTQLSCKNKYLKLNVSQNKPCYAPPVTQRRPTDASGLVAALV